MLLIGSHVGFNKTTQLLGSLEEALSYGCNAFMFYTGAPQNTVRYQIDDNLTYEALLQMKKNNINYENVIVHAPYIVNLANRTEEEKYKFAISFLQQETQRCDQLGIKYMVLHPGSHVGQGKDEGIRNIINGLNQILDRCNVTILLETMAGKGTEIGSNFAELKEIIDGINYKDKIGICLDTCHLNDAGYDVRYFDALLDEFDNVIGLEYIHCIHINDSKNAIASHKDRHENIGYGMIGFENLINIIYNKRLENVPKILETPYVNDVPPYKLEIELIKNKSFLNFKDKLL